MSVSANGSTEVLWTDAARTTAKSDGRQFLNKLREAGALSLNHGDVKLKAFREPSHPGLQGGRSKLIHFVRHGQGYHNLLADMYNELGLTYNTTGEKDLSATHSFGNPYQRPEIRDPPLTELGRKQARALRSAATKLKPELVVVSPMCRATQTALLGFSHLLSNKSPDTAVPFLAHEGLRELRTSHPDADGDEVSRRKTGILTCMPWSH
eukprot:scaffold2639_cov385-Prasinococcus_capsulatus_cf.AAC.2